MKKKNNTYMAMLPYIIVLVIILTALFFLNTNRDTVHDLKTGELIQAIKNEEVSSITITPKSSESVFYITGKLKDYEKQLNGKRKAMQKLP
jgi:hypothetical protein